MPILVTINVGVFEPRGPGVKFHIFPLTFVVVLETLLIAQTCAGSRNVTENIESGGGAGSAQ